MFERLQWIRGQGGREDEEGGSGQDSRGLPAGSGDRSRAGQSARGADGHTMGRRQLVEIIGGLAEAEG